MFLCKINKYLERERARDVWCVKVSNIKWFDFNEFTTNAFKRVLAHASPCQTHTNHIFTCPDTIVLFAVTKQQRARETKSNRPPNICLLPLCYARFNCKQICFQPIHFGPSCVNEFQVKSQILLTWMWNIVRKNSIWLKWFVSSLVFFLAFSMDVIGCL